MISSYYLLSYLCLYQHLILSYRFISTLSFDLNILCHLIVLSCLTCSWHRIVLTNKTNSTTQRNIFMFNTDPTKQTKNKKQNGWTQVLVEWQALSVSYRTHTVILIVKSYDRGQNKTLHQWENVHWHLRNWYFVTANKFLMTTVEFALR